MIPVYIACMISSFMVEVGQSDRTEGYTVTNSLLNKVKLNKYLPSSLGPHESTRGINAPCSVKLDQFVLFMLKSAVCKIPLVLFRPYSDNRAIISLMILVSTAVRYCKIISSSIFIILLMPFLQLIL